jgi:YD repeat-containing protein
MSPRTDWIEPHGRKYRVTWIARGQRLRRTFPTENEARDFLSRLQNDPTAQASRVKGGLTVAEVVNNWYRGHQRNLSSGTRRDYEGRIGRDVSRIGSMPAEELAQHPRLLREFYGTLQPVSARRLHAILRQAFQDAFDHGEVSRNPCALARPRRPRVPERRIPSPAEVELIIRTADDGDLLWGLFVNVTATIGTRRGETCGLRWEDVDFKSRRVHIKRALCKGVNGPVEVKLPKTGRERTVMIGEAFFDQLRDRRQVAGWIFTGGRSVPVGDAPWHPDWPGHRFASLMRLLDLPYTLHSLRHFVATQLLAKGMPVTQVAQFMGHKDPSVTMDLYANHVVDDVQRMMGEVAASLFKRRPRLRLVDEEPR